MRRIIPLLIALGIVGAFVWTLFFLYKKSEPKPVVFTTVVAERRDVIKKTVAPGALVPREEVTIKPRVSGVVEKLHVQPGQYVKDKALLAKIQIIPNVVSVNQAETNLRSAEISFQSAQTEFERFSRLRKQGLVTETDFAQQELAFKLRKQELEAAENNLQLVRVGASKRSGNVSNLVHSTVEGMVLEVPVKEGASVIEANNFNEGTTIAAIADMNDMIFQGRVDESEVGTLKEGMQVAITVGALGDERFEAKLEYIAPKGVAKEGTIEFEVRAAVKLKPTVFLRANYSANADIILEQRSRVLAVNESVIIYENGKTFVEVASSPTQFERRPVTLGLSDGIWVEVQSGVSETTKIKQQEGTQRSAFASPGGG
jgi:HlyD family secretion protein